MWLMLAHPEVATRSCDDCKKWRYNEQTGLRQTIPGTEIPVARFEGEVLPCQMDVCPKGSPEADIALWPHNLAAYQHYQRCHAVGRFPDDSLVERNAAIIAEVHAQWQQMNQRHLERMISQLAMH